MNCWLCLEPGADTQDHIVPKYPGRERGTETRAAHYECNYARGDLPVEIVEELRVPDPVAFRAALRAARTPELRRTYRR